MVSVQWSVFSSVVSVQFSSFSVQFSSFSSVQLVQFSSLNSFSSVQLCSQFGGRSGVMVVNQLKQPLAEFDNLYSVCISLKYQISNY